MPFINGADMEIYNFKFWYLWFTIVTLYFLLSYVGNVYIYTDNSYYNTLSNRIDLSRITEMMALRHKFQGKRIKTLVLSTPVD